MAHSLTTIGVHLESAIQTKMVVELELALIERKQSRQFRHKSIIMQESYNLFDFGTIPSYARKIRKGSRRFTLCQGQRSCRAKNSKDP